MNQTNKSNSLELGPDPVNPTNPKNNSHDKNKNNKPTSNNNSNDKPTNDIHSNNEYTPDNNTNQYNDKPIQSTLLILQTPEQTKNGNGSELAGTKLVS